MGKIGCFEAMRLSRPIDSPYSCQLGTTYNADRRYQSSVLDMLLSIHLMYTAVQEELNFRGFRNIVKSRPEVLIIPTRKCVCDNTMYMYM